MARVVGHYSGTGSLGLGFGVEPTAPAIALGTPLWSSEDGPWRSDWIGAQLMARILNINYIQGRETSTSIWSLVTSFYDILPLPNTGLLRANQPWTGHYEVQPAVWAVAHTTQFAAPGWRYLDAASQSLPSGGTAVSLVSPNGSDYSVIAETQGATSPQTITIQPGRSLSQRTIHVWRSGSRANFVHGIDLTPSGGALSIVLQPDKIYSFTTTSGQRHGTTTDIPAARVLPVDYADDFSSYAVGATPRLFSDESGSFQVAKRRDGPGNVWRQMVRHEGIIWYSEPQPVTVIGDRTWSNYQVDVDAHADTATQLTLSGRVTAVPETTSPPLGYFAQLGDNGVWSLQAPGGGGTSSILASGTPTFPAH